MIFFMPITGIVKSCLLRVRYVSGPVLRLCEFLHSILLSLLHHLTPPTSPASDKPKDFVTVFYHWFFIEILAAIGGHSLI